MSELISFLLGFAAGAVAARVYYAKALTKLAGLEEWAKRKIDAAV